MKIEGGLCTLCLGKCEDFKAVVGNTKNILDILLPNIDFTVIQEPGVCENCEEMLIKSFDFIETCMHTQNYILLDNKDDVKLDLDVCESRNITGVPEVQDICAFCLCQVNNYSAVSLDAKDGNVLGKMIEQCLPELDLSIIKKRVICASCHGSLKDCFHFVTNCLIIAEKIKIHCEAPYINSEGQMKLSSSLQLAARDVRREVDGNWADTIKVEHFHEDTKNADEKELSNVGATVKLEQISFNDIEGANMDVENKNESFMAIGDQKINNEQQFAPKKLLAIAEESSEIAAMKREEIFYGENETKCKEEDLVEEDQQFLLNNDIEIKIDEHDLNRFGHGIILTEEHTPKTESRDGFEEHLLAQNDPLQATIYKCSICSYQSKDKSVFISHLMIHKDLSELTVYKCDFCSYQATDKRNLKSHLLVHKGPSEVTMHKCDLCSFETKRKNYLKRHMLLHKNPSEVTMYKCKQCSFQTKRRGSLNIHIRNIHTHKDLSEEITVYTCDTCSFRTKYKQHLKNHLVNHKDPSEVNMYKCTSCSYQTKRKSCLKEHLILHESPSEIMMYECEHCSFQTKRKGSLRKHLLTHKDPSEVKVYKCDSCLYQATEKRNFKSHLLVHKDPSEVTMHECDYCSFRTKRKDYLKKHQMLHKNTSKVTIYKCNYCPYQAKYIGSVRLHLLTHKDSSDVTANTSDACLSQTDSKSHDTLLENLSDVTMYKCYSCSFETKHKGSLIGHMLLHRNPSEVTMHECDFCSFRTKHKRYLNSHMKLHKSMHKDSTKHRELSRNPGDLGIVVINPTALAPLCFAVQSLPPSGSV